MGPRVRVILNQASGKSQSAAAAIADAFSRTHLAVEVEPVDPAHLAAAAERAAAQCDTLVAAGGDGTVSAVAAAALRAGVTFGVIPLGTLNHFARDAGIPLDPGPAVAAIASGTTHQVDVGEINGRMFVNNVSLGIYPRLVWERELERRRGRSKWMAFAIALVRTWRRYPTVTVHMTAHTDRIVHRTPFVFVGNGNYRATGTAIGTRDALTTGVLSVFHAPEVDRSNLLLMPARALVGRLDADVHFHCGLVPELSIDAARRTLDVAVDGELAAIAPPLHFVCRPRALRLLLPSAA